MCYLQVVCLDYLCLFKKNSYHFPGLKRASLNSREFGARKQLQMSLTRCVAYDAVQGETQNRGGEQLVAASRVLLRSLIDFILELLRELQGGGNCHYKQPGSLAVHRTQSVEIHSCGLQTLEGKKMRLHFRF